MKDLFRWISRLLHIYPKGELRQAVQDWLLIHGNECDGETLRECLRDDGYKLSLANFYRFMSNLEREGIVSGYYSEIIVRGQKIKHRRYRLKE